MKDAASIFPGKLDDRYARELNYTDYYEAKMFSSYLTKEQIFDMNSVFKERKDVFEGYNEFRRDKLGLDILTPYDLFIQTNLSKQYRSEQGIV
jgi:oligoendopeptidase F